MNEVQIIIEPQEININEIVDMFITEHKTKIQIEIEELNKQLPTSEMLDKCLINDFEKENQDTIQFFKNKGYDVMTSTDFGYEYNTEKRINRYYKETMCYLYIIKNEDIQILTFNDTIYTTYNEMYKIKSDINTMVSNLNDKKNNIENKKQDILAEITKMKLKNTNEGREFLESLNIV